MIYSDILKNSTFSVVVHYSAVVQLLRYPLQYNMRVVIVHVLRQKEQFKTRMYENITCAGRVEFFFVKI